MDISAWLVSGALPAAIAALTCWWASRWAGIDRGGGSLVSESPLEANTSTPPASALTRRQRLAPAVLGLGWAIAVSVALIGQRRLAGDESSHWWPDEFWQRGYWWLL